MKYNPITKELYTGDDTFLKKLHCPLAKQWEELQPTNFLKGKMCDQCNRTVYDTAHLSDTELRHLINNKPHSCLKVDLSQDNLTITYNQYGQ